MTQDILGLSSAVCHANLEHIFNLYNVKNCIRIFRSKKKKSKILVYSKKKDLSYICTMSTNKNYFKDGKG